MARRYPPEMIEHCYQQILALGPNTCSPVAGIAYGMTRRYPTLYKALCENHPTAFLEAVRLRLNRLVRNGAIRLFAKLYTSHTAYYSALPQPPPHP